MTIAIRCPHCDKSYSLKDELKGKRVACTNPNCKKVFTIDPAKATVPAAAPAKPANVDELALAALADDGAKAAETKAPEAAVEAKIKVKCQFCDQESFFDARMAGKNAPCQNEDCRKIIKVPLPKKEDPKDWRNVQKRPTMAKVDAPELEGAWGNVQTTAVSREALVEAEANRVEEREPRSWGTIIKISLIAVALLLFLVIGAVVLMKKMSNRKQDKAMEMAMKFVEPKSAVKLKKEEAALLYMFAGEYDLAQDKPADAKSKFISARGGIEAQTTPERRAALIELAARQVTLAGNKEQSTAGKRLDWDKDKVGAEVRSTLTRMQIGPGEESRDVLAYALRRLTRAFVDQGNITALEALAKELAPQDSAESLAVIGLELLAMGRREDAERIAKQASNGQPTTADSLIALWLALGAPDAGPDKKKIAEEKARLVAAPPTAEAPSLVIRAGYGAGWVREGAIDKGRELARRSGTPEDRFRAMAAVAAVVVQTRKGDVSDLEECAKLAETDVKGRAESKWLLFRLVKLSLDAGNPKLAARFANVIPDAGLKAWANYEILANGGEGTPDSVGGEDRLARWMAVVESMRQKASSAGKGAASSEVAGWTPSAAQAFGYAGIALSEK